MEKGYLCFVDDFMVWKNFEGWKNGFSMGMIFWVCYATDGLFCIVKIFLYMFLRSSSQFVGSKGDGSEIGRNKWFLEFFEGHNFLLCLYKYIQILYTKYSRVVLTNNGDWIWFNCFNTKTSFLQEFKRCQGKCVQSFCLPINDLDVYAKCVEKCKKTCL